VRRGLVKLTWYIKIQTFAKSTEELWYEEWKSPYEHTVEVGDPKQFLESLKAPIQPGYELRGSYHTQECLPPPGRCMSTRSTPGS
jgi:hypothetical protein